ncbi:hypothetical protein [Humisphaera borealis]|uniref:3-keto-disaccharide hydrolase domain-containing protein n=1 Tax=Humisphaera borealis TaxID=2807512 RepID=A0A7M2WYI4_9BACT|nr:hypothetical protein [Humisphaera borealis]QOV90548.1 hypothetical protein IPV69_04045 [Humisphaera borealis]
MLRKLVMSMILMSPLAVLAADKPADSAPAREKDGLPLVFHEDFSEGEKAIEKFDIIDPTDWKMSKNAADKWVLNLFKRPTDASSGKLPVRSPFGRAMVKDLYVGEFVMEVKMTSTIPAYGHQDLCLHFGEVDPTHLYYVHFGRKPDPNAGNIFIVDGTPRKNLLPPHDKGIEWTEKEHVARVVRKPDGLIQIYFDGKLWLEVKNDKFPVGRVGVGSFDDTGEFSEITVWGKKAEKPAPLPQPQPQPTAKPAPATKAPSKTEAKPAK